MRDKYKKQVALLIRIMPFNQKFYYMWQKYFIVIILFCLYACKGERKEQNTNSTTSVPFKRDDIYLIYL